MTILQVAIHSPLRKLFDYLPPDDHAKNDFIPGQRVEVPFGNKSTRVGIVIAITDSSEHPVNKIKKVIRLIDKEPLFSKKHLQLLKWTSDYYHHSLGDTIFTSLPSALRKTKNIQVKKERLWRLTSTGKKIDVGEAFARAKKQQLIFEFIKEHETGITQTAISAKINNCQPTLKVLFEKSFIEFVEIDTKESENKTVSKTAIDQWQIKPNKQQQNAIDAIIASSDKYQAFLLNGVTGSGKTEVYLQIIRHTLASNKQVLILVPEIGLTPQIIELIKERFHNNVTLLHSGLSDSERLANWQAARKGKVQVILGTRSAIWTPLPKLGLIIIDEEHDLSYKQQDGLRYSARDLALIRAQKEKIPVVLGSATPSLESLKNAKEDRYQELRLKQRVSNSVLPEIQIHDVRNSAMHGAISAYLVEEIKQCLNNKQQVLLFLNRRGYSPVIMCHDCGYISQCSRCDAYLTYHKRNNKLSCHHCEHSENLPETCPECAHENLHEIGHGTERLSETLSELFPKAHILRIDRDSTRRKGSMQSLLDEIHSGKADILVGTQMLAKGHHFPSVTLVGIVDADGGLFSIDFRASERMAQQLIQVSGRAGRSESPGKVIIQTHQPDHPLLMTLAEHKFDTFSQLLMQEREQSQLPPFSYQALLRAEANQKHLADKFLNMAKTRLNKIADQRLELYGPIPAPMEKRSGRFRQQLLVQANSRQMIRKYLTPWIESLAESNEGRKVRWSIDVDPQDMI